MPEISEEELAELRAARAERDQMKETGAPAPAPVARTPPRPQYRAFLADGTTVEYAGAHPTHVSREGPGGREVVVPVMAVYPIQEES